MIEDENMEVKIDFLKIMNSLRKGSMINFGAETTKGEGIIILSVWENMRETGNNYVRVSTIVNQLNFSPQSISRILRSLETRGLINRMADKVDRRNTIITLTEKGEEQLETLKANAFAFCSTVMERMGNDDMRELVRLLEKCSNIMNETAAQLSEETEVLNNE